jgi:glutathione S-transferase
MFARAASAAASRALTWSQLATSHAASFVPEKTLTNSQATLRLFGQPESEVRVTLFRDNHAWCPYCQKVWLFLEEKKIPYRIKKVTMFCYGQKEAWYKKIVPSGMLPALQIDGSIITESDVVLHSLEEAFGPLGAPMREIMPQRQLERQLFRAWCSWLCYPDSTPTEQSAFESALVQFERELGKHAGPWILGGEAPSLADLIFVPYVERMCASLFYYKGFDVKESSRRPNVARWFEALETRSTYIGTQSDYHTHCHDLPPQMGGCYASGSAAQKRCASLVDVGPYASVPDTYRAEPETSRAEAIYRVCKHRESIVRANPCADEAVIDEALRCALTRLATGKAVTPPRGSETALRYIRDRVNVPRDMSLWAARRLREALEETGQMAGAAAGPPIPTDHRRDQDPRAFRTAG